MRNISFNLTKEQIRNRTKTVTRRLGWSSLKPGELLQACEKCQGIQKGGLVKLCVIRVVGVHRERLDWLLDGRFEAAQQDIDAEGFPEKKPVEFVEMFCKHMRCTPDTEVTRIKFEYL